MRSKLLPICSQGVMRPGSAFLGEKLIAYCSSCFLSLIVVSVEKQSAIAETYQRAEVGMSGRRAERGLKVQLCLPEGAGARRLTAPAPETVTSVNRGSLVERR